MSKKIIIIICVILLLITAFASCKTLKIYKQKKEINKYLDYINSDAVEHRMETPEFMHVVLAEYKGDAKGLSILKSLEYFTCDVIPDIKKNCGNDFKAKSYYNNHKIQLENQIGINNYNDFYEICKKLDFAKNLGALEYTKINTDSIKRTNNGLDFVIYYKYSDVDEISFNITIDNSTYQDKGFINVK